MNYILADNQELTRFALEGLIRQDSQNVLHFVTDKAGLVQKLKEYADAVVVLDYTMFDFADEEQFLIVCERFEASQWVLISDELTPSFLKRVIYASRQVSVVFKDSPLSEIRDVLKKVAHHERYVSQRTLEVIIAQQQEEEKPDVLTATEVEIIKGIAQGKTTKEIAAERFSSVHTVTTHRKNIFRKLNINTAHEATRYALRAGLIDSSEFYI